MAKDTDRSRKEIEIKLGEFDDQLRASPDENTMRSAHYYVKWAIRVLTEDSDGLAHQRDGNSTQQELDHDKKERIEYGKLISRCKRFQVFWEPFFKQFKP